MTTGPIRFSLIVATTGRVRELERLLGSLVAQHESMMFAPAFEVVLVDQSGDDRLLPILRNMRGCVPVKHVRSDTRAVSHARNLALPHCRGEIACFPDDDCTYPPGLLAAIDAAFHLSPDTAIVTGIVADPSGKMGRIRWPKKPLSVTRANIWHTVMSAALFVRLPTLRALGGFDHRLGIGADFGAAEETDLVLRAMERGNVAYFQPLVVVHHSNPDLGRIPVRRAYDYGRGCGFVLRHHGFPLRTVMRFAVRPLGGMLLALLCLRAGVVGYYAGMLVGRASGYLAGRKLGLHAS